VSRGAARFRRRLRFVAPPRARSQQQLQRLENNPYYKTRLAPGKTAPNWSATTLDGRPFSVAGLRGKPALLLLFADWCPAADPATCDVFPQLEQVYQRANHRVAIVGVDFQGKANEPRKIAHYQHLTFPVVFDRGAMVNAWKIHGMPYWLLLDSRGRVIEARFKPQTFAQLDRLLGEAKQRLHGSRADAVLVGLGVVGSGGFGAGSSGHSACAIPTTCAARSTVGLTFGATSRGQPVHRASVSATSSAWIPELSMKLSCERSRRTSHPAVLSSARRVLRVWSW
jgi:peroxiredoxin